MAVGAQFSARIEVSTCGGNKILHDEFAWTSSDTAVATISPVFLSTSVVIVRARAVGSASITVMGKTYGKLYGPEVTVHGAP